MAAKRKQSTGLSERIGVAETQVEGVLSQMSELKDDVKEVLRMVGEIKIDVSKLPTWAELEKKSETASRERESVEDRIKVLEAARASLKAGWTVISFFGGVAVIVIGWAISIWIK